MPYFYRESSAGAREMAYSRRLVSMGTDIHTEACRSLFSPSQRRHKVCGPPSVDLVLSMISDSEFATMQTWIPAKAGLLFYEVFSESPGVYRGISSPCRL
jgi:hypothetical protein